MTLDANSPAPGRSGEPQPAFTGVGESPVTSGDQADSTPVTGESRPITEGWLKSVGFRWAHYDRVPDPKKHWILWLGWRMRQRTVSVEDIGIELAPGTGGDEWHCWLRADYDSRYARFMHVRYLKTVRDVELLITGLIGEPFSWSDVYFGALRTPEALERIRQEENRLDLYWLRTGRPGWKGDEHDATKDPRPRA